ncbi:VOC family protein [Yinghuangia aomiensis]|uniref:VOC family protein n=2 Tax=Yinghuangia aomiensis TaxID=676205 RepID=A0ABP9H676_9ACTN
MAAPPPANVRLGGTRMSIMTGTYPPGVPCWADLGTADPDASLAFYGTVFGWHGAPGPGDADYYTSCAVRGRRVAGIRLLPEPDLPIGWTTYLATDDADAAVVKAAAEGAEVTYPPMDVLDMGRFALLTDPTGAPFGLWQARSLVGAELVNEPGGIVWTELLTRNTPRALAFYGALFGYAFEDMSAEGFDYHAFSVDDRPRGGIMGMDANWPDELPAHWHVTFRVADTDATAGLVRAAGGTVLSEPRNSPYGRIAQCRDPHGADFAILKSDEHAEDHTG